MAMIGIADGRARFGVAAVALLGLGGGCGFRVNDEHCLFHGGDRACEDEQLCLAVSDGGSVIRGRNGCWTVEGPLRSEHAIHLRYGLPTDRMARGDPLESDTVQGVLARTVQERDLGAACAIDEQLPEMFEDSEVVDIVMDARARLERYRRRGRARREEIYLSQAEADAVEHFNAAVDQWAQTCEPMPGGASEETSDEMTGTTGDSPCLSDEDCPEMAPICLSDGVCVRCDTQADDFCGTIDPARPICDQGACVECIAGDNEACRSEGWVCSAASRQCVPCTEHAQCGEAACDLAEGRCFPEGAVAHVGPGWDVLSIGDAINAIDLGASGTIILHEDDYYESVVLAGERKVALLAADGESPTWDNSGIPQLLVFGSTVFIDGLRLAGNTSTVALQVDGGSAWVDRTQIVQNAIGVDARNNATLVLRNCMVGFVSGNSFSAVEIFGSSATIISSTLIGDNLAGYDLYCDARSSVTVRNSIVVNYDDLPIPCPWADISYSVVNEPFPGMGNEAVGSVSLENFFANPFSGDYHLAGNGVTDFADIARWQTGDPATDLDGDPRPDINGSLDYAGADVP